MTQKNNGFTLVELAIALMVIGLLIGGVLKGQELIENARITRTIKDFSDFDTAVMIFRTSYNGLPGDFAYPNRLNNCTGTTLCANVTGVGTGTWNSTIKQTNVWRHLAAAGLISSINEANPVVATFRGISPYNAFDGNYHTNYPTSWPENAATTTVPLNMNVFEISDPATAESGTANFPPKQSAALDSKMDDGKPFAGSIRSVTNCSKTEDGNVLYNAESTTKCRLYILSNSAN